MPVQQILQLHNNPGVLYRLLLLLDLAPNGLVELIWEDDLNTLDEANLVDCSPWLLLGRWLLTVDVAGERAKSREDLGVCTCNILTEQRDHIDGD